MRAFIVIVLAACGGGTKAAPPPEPPPVVVAKAGPTCESAVVKSIEVSLANPPPAATPEADVEEWRTSTKAMHDPLLAACTEDKWTPEVIACMDTAATIEAGATCAEKLTNEQIEGVVRRVQAAIPAARK